MIRLFVILFITISVVAKRPAPEIYRIYKSGGFVKTTIYKVKGHQVNKKCYQKLSKCMAIRKLVAVIKGYTKDSRYRSIAGHPAAIRCKELKGKYKILHKDYNRIGFCRFKDGSMINAWSLVK